MKVLIMRMLTFDLLSQLLTFDGIMGQKKEDSGIRHDQQQ